MSHITMCKTQFNSLDAIKVAAEALGFEFVEGKKTHAWYGRMVSDSAEGIEAERALGRENLGKCEHVLRLKDHRQGDYEIGLVRTDSGEWRPIADFWGPGHRLLERVGNDDYSKLRQEYGIAVTQARVEKTLARQGFKMTRENIGDGRVRLRLQRRTS